MRKQIMLLTLVLAVCACLAQAPSALAGCDKSMSKEANSKAENMADSVEDLAEKWADSGCDQPTRRGERLCSDLAKSAAEDMKALDEHVAATVPVYEQAIAKYEKKHDHKMRKYMTKKLDSLKEYQDEVHKTALYAYLKQSNLIP